MHTVRIEKPHFELIKSGAKLYEIRLNDEKRRNFKIGDTLTFLLRPELTEKCITQITEIISFKSFYEICETIPATELGFDGSSPDEIVNECYKIYSPEEEKRYGVVTIKIEVI
ncbi:MAG: ASCH domain-containing protein [Firmicutes bacterium]|nr:ASCH domain-containing protein [Bacillota bacterium]